MEKWFIFGNKTTNLLKYAVFEINDWRCEEEIFRRNTAWNCGGVCKTLHSTSLQNYFWTIAQKVVLLPPNQFPPLCPLRKR